MKITTELRPSYCLISKNKTTFDHLRSTRIVRESSEDECWKWKCRYKVMFENEQDFKDAFLFYGRSDFNGSLSNEELLKFLSVKYFKNKKLFKINRHSVITVSRLA